MWVGRERKGKKRKMDETRIGKSKDNLTGVGRKGKGREKKKGKCTKMRKVRIFRMKWI